MRRCKWPGMLRQDAADGKPRPGSAFGSNPHHAALGQHRLRRPQRGPRAGSAVNREVSPQIQKRGPVERRIGRVVAAHHLERSGRHPHDQSRINEAKVVNCYQQWATLRKVLLTDNLEVGQQGEKEINHSPQHPADQAPTGVLDFRIGLLDHAPPFLPGFKTSGIIDQTEVWAELEVHLAFQFITQNAVHPSFVSSIYPFGQPGKFRGRSTDNLSCGFDSKN